jgi:hypothetical protein
VVSGHGNAAHARTDGHPSNAVVLDEVQSFFGDSFHFRPHLGVVFQNFVEICGAQDKRVARRGRYHARYAPSVCEKANFWEKDVKISKNYSRFLRTILDF